MKRMYILNDISTNEAKVFNDFFSFPHFCMYAFNNKYFLYLQISRGLLCA